jgi:hypothetical protein
MEILSLITLKNGVDMTFEIKESILSFEMDQPTDKDMMVTIHAVPNSSGLCSNKVAYRVSSEEATRSVCPLPYDTDAIIQKTEGLQCTFHHSALNKKLLRPGTYIFTFSNDPSVHFSVVFINNKLSFEVY